MGVIVLNMVQMGLSFDGQSKSYTQLLEYINYFFTAVFVIEAVLKLLTYQKAYFYTTWNKFDFFVVCSSLLDILMTII